MSVIYVVLPLAVVLAACAVAGFIWAARRGQFDDLDTPRFRVLTDDVDSTPPAPAQERLPGTQPRLGVD